jgi:hypothetical protein
MSKTFKASYRVPSITPEPVELESISLDDFNLDDIREYLARQDGDIPDDAPRHDRLCNTLGNTSLLISAADINRIETLAICGQTEHARQHALDLISAHIARPL